MATTPNNFRLTGRVLGSGLLWGGLALPTNGSRLTLAAADSDGFRTPDSVQNPNAYPIGATKDQITVSAKTSRTKYYVDQIKGPIDSQKQQVEAQIRANIVGINDPVMAKLIGAGFVTQTISTGFVDNKLGEADDIFTGIALIAPMRENPLMMFVFHLYKAINDSGFEWGVGSTEMASNACTFDGYAVPTRPKADLYGNWWWETPTT